MSGTDYNVALVSVLMSVYLSRTKQLTPQQAVFFVPYVLAEVPSNMILAKFERPSVYMSILILAWGTVMTLSGVVQNFAGLVATRFFLGLAEAGFFPGTVEETDRSRILMTSQVQYFSLVNGNPMGTLLESS
jgi:MFS family permease